jgi:hypothetical protein
LSSRTRAKQVVVAKNIKQIEGYTELTQYELSPTDAPLQAEGGTKGLLNAICNESNVPYLSFKILLTAYYSLNIFSMTIRAISVL